MGFKIAIASGKGGTGKTSLAVNLLHQLGRRKDRGVLLVDCDVEEPNDLIFFPHALCEQVTKAQQLIPFIRTHQCTFCRKCAEYCAFNAVSVIPRLKFAEIDEGLCHSCGACLLACKEGAIIEEEKLLGEISTFQIGEGRKLVEGRLRIGSSMQTLMIRETKRHIPSGYEVILYDAPPGTSCPVVETISGSDYVVLVTEPTPFGIHDLHLMVELMEDLAIPFGVVINKGGIGDGAVYELIRKKQIELLGEIPFLREYASRYAAGTLLSDAPPEILDALSRIAGRLERIMTVHERTYHHQW